MRLIASIGVCVNIALAFVPGTKNHVHLPGPDHGHGHSHEHVDLYVTEERMEVGEVRGENSVSNDGRNHSHGHQGKVQRHNYGSNHNHNHSHGHQGLHSSESDPLFSRTGKSCMCRKLFILIRSPLRKCHTAMSTTKKSIISTCVLLIFMSWVIWPSL